MSTSPADASPSDPLPSELRSVLGLFREELGDQRFGDVDAEALETLAEVVRERARHLEEVRARLDASRGELDRALKALTEKAQQGLAYARIFAASDPELAARVEELAPAPSPPSPRRKKRRGASTKGAGRPAAAPGAEAEPREGVLPFAQRGAA